MSIKKKETLSDFLILKKNHPEHKKQINEVYNLFNRDLILLSELIRITKRIIKKGKK